MHNSLIKMAKQEPLELYLGIVQSYEQDRVLTLLEAEKGKPDEEISFPKERFEELGLGIGEYFIFEVYANGQPNIRCAKDNELPKEDSDDIDLEREIELEARRPRFDSIDDWDNVD